MTQVGRIGWIDLTVEDASAVRDFYASVIGWDVEPVDMGGYEDFTLCPPGTNEGIAGICHASGSNSGLPAQWLMYVTVANLTDSIARVTTLGGRVVRDPAPLAGGSFCVIEDPAGAVCALYQEPSKA